MGTDALRKCKHCGLEAHTENELDIFSSMSAGKYGRSLECKPCHNKRKASYRKLNPSSYRDSNQKWQCVHIYKITLEEYKERMSSSDVCEICNAKDNLCYDHDHKTMEFRGVLCKKCNKGLGNLGDTLEGVMRAVNYLSKEIK